MWPFTRRNSDGALVDVGGRAPSEPSWQFAEPNETTDVSIADLAGDTLTAKLAQISPGTRVLFPAGTYADADFDRPANYPVYCIFEQKAGPLIGTSVKECVLSIQPNSATQSFKRIADLRDYVDVNPYFMVRVDGTVLICNLTFQGTDQAGLDADKLPIDYNNLLLFQTTNAVVRDVRVLGHRGSKAYPPGETMAINDYRGQGLLLERVEIDGRNPQTGASQTASGFGANFAENETFNDCYFHDLAHGSGMTSYQGTGTWTANDVWSVRSNWAGFNFERGRDLDITLNRCRSVDNAIDLVIDSDLGSSRVTINDPILDPGQRFRVCVHQRYGYPPGPNTPPNKQKTSDITLRVDGVERADLLEIVSNYRPLTR